MTSPDERQNEGYEAEVSRALNAPRTLGGIDQRVFSLWWGPIGMVAISQHLWWIALGGLVGHLVFYYLTYRNPSWFEELRQNLRQPRFLRR
jgi:type IV secretory pathway TrbD component